MDEQPSIVFLELQLQVKLVPKVPGVLNPKVDVVITDANAVDDQYGGYSYIFPLLFHNLQLTGLHGAAVTPAQLPGITYVLQEGRDGAPLNMCLIKILLQALKRQDSRGYNRNAQEGMQWMLLQLKALADIDISWDLVPSMKLYTVFLEVVPERAIKEFFDQLLELPLIMFLKTEVAKISDFPLFSKSRLYASIDLCFVILKTILASEELELSSPLPLFAQCPPVAVWGNLWVLPGRLKEGCVQELLANQVKTFVVINNSSVIRCSGCQVREFSFQGETASESQLLEFLDVVERNTITHEKWVINSGERGSSEWFVVLNMLSQMVTTQGTNVVLGSIMKALQKLYDLCGEDIADMFTRPFAAHLNCERDTPLMRFQSQYSSKLAKEFTLEVLTFALKTTVTLKQVGAMIRAVDGHAYHELFVNTGNMQFLAWLFLMTKCLLMKQEAKVEVAEPPAKKRRVAEDSENEEEENHPIVSFSNPEGVSEYGVMSKWSKEGPICQTNWFGCKLNVLVYLGLMSRTDAESIFNVQPAYRHAFSFAVLLQYLNTQTRARIVEEKVAVTKDVSELVPVLTNIYYKLPNHSKTLVTFNEEQKGKYDHAAILAKEEPYLYLVDPLFSTIARCIDIRDEDETNEMTEIAFDQTNYWAIHFVSLSYPVYDESEPESNRVLLNTALRCKSQFIDAARYLRKCDPAVLALYNQFLQPELNVDCEDSTREKSAQLRQAELKCASRKK